MPSRADLSSLLRCLFGQDPERFEHGDAGTQEDSQLTAEMHQLPLVDLLLGDLELEEALLLQYRDRLQVAVEQRGRGGPR